VGDHPDDDDVRFSGTLNVDDVPAFGVRLTCIINGKPARAPAEKKRRDRERERERERERGRKRNSVAGAK